MAGESEYVEIKTTVPEDLDAKHLADGLIRQRLAACVHYHKLRSIYRWNDNIEETWEYAVVAKTRGALAEKVVDYIRSGHTYDVPQIIVTPVLSGNDDYLEWINKETSPS